MALTKADKEWIRRTVKAAIANIPVLEQIGSYDGATEYKDDLDESEYVEFRRSPMGLVTPAVSDMKK